MNFEETQEYLNLVKNALETELEGNHKMMENHLMESQEVIANISVLRDIGGIDPAKAALAALEVAAANPQSGEQK